jgi:ATP-binding cassette subfamily F protein 3
VATRITLSQVSLALGHKTLFSELDASVNDGDRIGLVGHNGSGKSTLLKMLAGELAPDSGLRQSQKQLRIGVVEQFLPPALATATLIDAALDMLSFDERVSARYRAETALLAVGFHAGQFDIAVSQLSGGQQNLLLMARTQLMAPDVMLLDEPGNHMDISSLAILEQWLSSITVPWIMVSHDRYLLNNLCRNTWVLRDQKLYSFQLPFDAAREALVKLDEDAQKQRNQEEREITRIETSAKRLAIWGRTFDNEDLARKAKTMEKRAQKLKDNVTFVSRGSGLELALDTEKLSCKQALVLEEATISVPNTDRVLANVPFLRVNPGDRIGLLGINGSGKSTTIKRIMAALDDSDPTIRINPNVKLGYYDQQLSALNCEETRYDWLRRQVEGPDDRIRQTLLHAGIPYQDFDQPVSQLSGGEKARMQFALFRLQAPNFLILDEPTNHIDLEGREALIDALIETGITLIVTSHDRAFLDQCVTHWWLIEDETISITHDPEGFYRSVYKQEASKHSQTVEPSKNSASMDEGRTDLPDTEAAILEQIEVLEQRLSDDLKRKAKHQLPERHAGWRASIADLWTQLEKGGL